MCVTVVQWSRSFLQVQMYQVPLPATLFPCLCVLFCVFFLIYYYYYFLTLYFLLACFPFPVFLLTADPADHALGSIYI